MKTIAARLLLTTVIALSSSTIAAAGEESQQGKFELDTAFVYQGRGLVLVVVQPR